MTHIQEASSDSAAQPGDAVKRKSVMRKADRLKWLLVEILNQPHDTSVDSLNQVFVDAYLEATDAPFDPMAYGAHRSAMLGRDLSTLHKQGYVDRGRIGLSDMRGMGFPAWVYCYSLNAMGLSEAKFQKELQSVDRAQMTKPSAPAEVAGKTACHGSNNQ